MKAVSEIKVLNRIWLQQNFVGYCDNVDRYLYGKHRAYPYAYHDFYFITEDQYRFIKDNEEALSAGRMKPPEFLTELLLLPPAGAGWIRDYYFFSHEARTINPVPFLDGPFLYDGTYFLYHVSVNGRHYAVPPLDMSRFYRNDKTKKNELPQGYREYHFDNEEFLLHFVGKDVTDDIRDD